MGDGFGLGVGVGTGLGVGSRTGKVGERVGVKRLGTCVIDGFLVGDNVKEEGTQVGTGE